MYDIIIIGSGPAGLTAAIYCRRAGKSVLVIEKGAFGGQITYSPKIENYPGIPSASGSEIADAMVSHALEQGTDIELDTVVEIAVNDDGTKTVMGESGEYQGRAVIIAVGCRHRRLGLEREDEFLGSGINYCAVCDGAFYAGKHVALVGGGNSALQEALLLSDICSRVTLIHRRSYFTAEAKLVEQVKAKDNIDILYECVVESILGDESFEGIKVRPKDGNTLDLHVDGVFISIGLVPENEPFASVAELDGHGYFKSDDSCTTKTPGIYVAGDCRAKEVRQITTAVSDGTIAAVAACRYLDGRA